MNETDKVLELRRLIAMLLEMITEEKKLREIYLFLNRIYSR